MRPLTPLITAFVNEAKFDSFTGTYDFYNIRWRRLSVPHPNTLPSIAARSTPGVAAKQMFTL